MYKEIKIYLISCVATYVQYVPFVMSPYSHYFPIISLYIHILLLPRIVAQAFISFQQFFTLPTKQDRHLLVEDSCAIYNL